MQYAKYSNIDGITRDESSSAQSACVEDIQNGSLNTIDINLYLYVALIVVPIVATVSTLVIICANYEMIKEKYTSLRQADQVALVLVGSSITFFIIGMDIAAVVIAGANKHEFKEINIKPPLTSIILVYTSLGIDILLEFLFVLIVLCCVIKHCKKNSHDKDKCSTIAKIFFTLSPLLLASSHIGYIFAAWLTEPSNTTSVAILAMALTTVEYLMFRFFYRGLKHIITRIKKIESKECCTISCTIFVGLIGLSFIALLVASFRLLPIETIGLVDYLQNIVNICVIFVTGLVAYITIFKADTDKFFKHFNMAYKKRNEILWNYSTIKIESKLQFDKFTKKKCGNDWMAVMEVESCKCIVEDPRDASKAIVTIVSAKLCTDSFSQNANTFETRLDKCFFEVKVLTADAAPLYHIPVSGDSKLSLTTTPNCNRDEYTASVFTFTFTKLDGLLNNQHIDINDVKFNGNASFNDKVGRLHLCAPIASISSNNASQRIGILCPFHNSVITFVKRQLCFSEITRILIPKKLSIQMFINTEDREVHIKHGRIFISSELKNFKILSQGSKIFISCVVPCNKISFNINEYNKLAVITNTPASSSDTNLQSIILEEISGSTQAVSTYFDLQYIMKKGIVLYLGPIGDVLSHSLLIPNIELIDNCKCLNLTTAIGDRIQITLNPDLTMSLSGLESSLAPVTLTEREVNIKLNSLSGLLHICQDITDGVELTYDDEYWNIHLENKMDIILEGSNSIEMLSLYSSDESSEYDNMVGGDIETAGTICGSLLSRL